MKSVFCVLFGVSLFVWCGCCPVVPEFVIDSFEGELDSTTVDFGASQGSSVAVSAAPETKACGEQSLKIEYDLKPSGYMWIARGFDLDVTGAAQWRARPEEISWKRYNAIKISMYGNSSNAVVAFDIKDAGGEIWRFLLDDDFNGWKEITCPFALFFARKDWQPDNADGNEQLDFPLKSFQFEPRLPGKGVLYFDCVTLVRAPRAK